MKKSILASLLMMAFVNVANAALPTVSWTDWTGNATGTFIQNSSTVNVTYTGQWNWIDTDANIFNQVSTSFTSANVTNTPGGHNTIAMVGGQDGVNTISFSQAVINPVIALWSVGQWGVPVSFNFLNSPTFSVTSQGAGHWGGGSLVQSGYSVTGFEGNGLLEFKGSYNSISFTTPNYENYYGITVGAFTTAPVPEPSTNGMLLLGLGLLGIIGYRRTNNHS